MKKASINQNGDIYEAVLFGRERAVLYSSPSKAEVAVWMAAHGWKHRPCGIQGCYCVFEKNSLDIKCEIMEF